MNALARTIAILTLEAVGIAAALACAGAVFVLLRLQSGPMRIDAAVPALEWVAGLALDQSLQIEIGSARLERAGAADSYRLTLDTLALTRAGAPDSMVVTQARLDFSSADLMAGRIGPRVVVVDGAALMVVRRADRTLDLDYGFAAGGGDADVFAGLTGGRFFREAFQSATLNEARIDYIDEVAGRSWRASGARASIIRTGGRYAALAEAEFELEDGPAALRFDADYTLADGIIEARLDVRRAPVADLVGLFWPQNSLRFAAPVSGVAHLRISRAGELQALRVDAEADPGVLTLEERIIPVERVAAALDFDPLTDRVAIRTFRVDSADLSISLTGGAVITGRTPDGDPASIAFDVAASDASITAPGDQTSRLAIASLTAAGSYGVGPSLLTLSRLEVDLGGLSIAGSAVADFSGPKPGFSADIACRGAVDKTRLMTMWPQSLASGAHDFVRERLIEGRFSEIAFRLDWLVPSEPPSLLLTFGAEGAKVNYAPGMTPIDGLKGRGELTADRFAFQGAGRVGAIAIRDGVFEIPQLRPVGQPAYIRFNASGGASDILAVMNQAPLQVLRATPLTPDQFSGTADIDVSIVRPNQRVVTPDQYVYEARAVFRNAGISELYRDVAFENANGTVDVKSRRMRIVSDGRLGGAPIKVDWSERLDLTKNRSKVVIVGEMDSATGDVFGIPTRQIMRGSAAFTATLAGDIGNIASLEVDADLTRAALSANWLAFAKPAGVPAKASIAMTFDDAGAQAERFTLAGEGMSVSGAARFNQTGRIQSADFREVRLAGAADLAFTAMRADDDLVRMQMTGAYFNAAPLIEALLTRERGSPDEFSGLFANTMATGRLEVVEMRNGVRLRDASLDLRHGQRLAEMLAFAAMDAHGHPVSVRLDHGAAGGLQRVIVRSDQIGTLLSGMFGLSSVDGGEGGIAIDFPRQSDGSPPRGVFEARNMRIVGAPLLARVFAAGSLTGLSDLLNGDGIELSQGFASFTIQPNSLAFENVRLTGPSVGLTAEGEIGFGSVSRIALNGAVAPAYSINSLLGRTPVIGDLFVNREGEGLVALSYQIDGSVAEPRVIINPLSALTPGILRRMFDPQPGTAPAPDGRPAGESAAGGAPPRR